jgi:CheY-like chemotaxis protein
VEIMAKNIAKTILVVDDNIEIRRLIGYILAPIYQVVEADCASNASIQLARYNPDLILLDINMPGVNGLEWCAMIRTWYKSRDIKIIMVSALNKSEEISEGERFGADGYVSKPFSPAILLEEISRHLSE